MIKRMLIGFDSHKYLISSLCESVMAGMEMCNTALMMLYMLQYSLHMPGTGAASGGTYLVETRDHVKAVSSGAQGQEIFKLFNCS